MTKERHYSLQIEKSGTWNFVRELYTTADRLFSERLFERHVCTVYNVKNITISEP